MKKKQFFLYKYNKNVLTNYNYGIKSLNQIAILNKILVVNKKILHNYYYNKNNIKKNNLTLITCFLHFHFGNNNRLFIKQVNTIKKINFKLKKYYIFMLYKRLNTTKNLKLDIFKKYYNIFYIKLYTN